MNLTQNDTGVELVEFGPDGAQRQVISINVNSLSVSGSRADQCLLNRTTDRQFLLLAGYAGTYDLAVTRAAVVRSVARVDALGNVDYKEIPSSYDQGFVGAVASPNGDDLWVVGTGAGDSGGLRYTRFGTFSVTRLDATSWSPMAINMATDPIGLHVSEQGGVYFVSGLPMTATAVSGSQFPVADFLDLAEFDPTPDIANDRIYRYFATRSGLRKDGSADFLRPLATFVGTAITPIPNGVRVWATTAQNPARLMYFDDTTGPGGDVGGMSMVVLQQVSGSQVGFRGIEQAPALPDALFSDGFE